MTEQFIYLGIKENGGIDSWSFLEISNHVAVPVSSLPENWEQGFGTRKWNFANGQFVQREEWEAEIQQQLQQNENVVTATPQVVFDEENTE